MNAVASHQAACGSVLSRGTGLPRASKGTPACVPSAGRHSCLYVRQPLINVGMRHSFVGAQHAAPLRALLRNCLVSVESIYGSSSEVLRIALALPPRDQHP